MFVKSHANLLIEAPGLLGDIARYIDSNLKYTQPAISLSLALGFCAALKSGRVVAEGVEPNLYTCVVAPSGTGKSQAQAAIQQLVTDSDLLSMLMGKPASDAGMLKTLAEEARRLLIWDEFGIALQELADSKASYRALILSLIMDLFSAAGKTYLGKEYATQRRTDIKAPYLSICAASTPNRFFSALDEDFVDDGFLSRWLIFLPEEEITDQVLPKQSTKHLIERVLAIDVWRPSTSKKNIKAALEVEKVAIDFSDVSIHKSTKRNYRDRVKNAKTEFERIFWSRAYELYLKVCLATCEKNFVTFDEALFATELVDSCIYRCIQACQSKLGETKRQKMNQRFANVIRPGEKLTAQALSKRVWNFNVPRYEKDKLISDLLDAGIWQKTLEVSEDSRRKTTYYFRALS